MDGTQLAEAIEARYRRYLQSTFYFKDRDLRASFEAALSSGHLSKGPYIEATPVFKRSQKPASLFPALLGSPPDEAFLGAVEGDRPLYEHQERAITRVSQGAHVIVATGTGSGKTEAFLYPVLLHLYKEFQAGALCPGVRALILYPMNALANDQRERLGTICQKLEEANSSFRFTFGQYIGETPENQHDSRRHASDHIADRRPGELVLRSEMRSQPPHILLTNYSMLEYLLLRPHDSPLFDNGNARWWTFLVLDEAHQYRGSRGTEMAMLLRRLKRRLDEGGRLKPLRCIATSATLVGAEGDRAAAAKFAADLFGEDFRADDVIVGEAEPLPAPGPVTLRADDYKLLSHALDDQSQDVRDRLSGLAIKVGVTLPANEDVKNRIGRLLQRDSRSTALRRLITGQPDEVRSIAAQVFDDLPDEERVRALSELVELLVRAEDPDAGAPLLSARYHLFLRSLEGAFVSYWPEKNVLLDRSAVDGEHAAFEVALCRECGQHYFVGPKGLDGGRLGEAVRDPGDPHFGASFFRPVENAGYREDDEEGEAPKGQQLFQLCARCGELRRDKPGCGHDSLIEVVREDAPDDDDRADQVARCGACGYTAGGRDPVREVVHGTDGPHAVIATTLYQTLPEERRKVLAFADGRQEAAFFAWYLQDTYEDILSRNSIVSVARQLAPHGADGLSLRDAATGLRGVFRERGVAPPAVSDLELRSRAWRQLYREFLTDEARISLEGVGLLRWSVKRPPWLEIWHGVKSHPWSLADREAWDVVCILLDFLRSDRAVELRPDSGVSLQWGDLSLRAWQMRVRIGPPKSQPGVRSWDGKSTRQAAFLAKLLRRTTPGLSEAEAVDAAIDALRELWEAFRESEQGEQSDHRLLISVQDARRLNPDWWRLRAISDSDMVFQCDTCGRLQPVAVRGVCPRHRCPGTLTAIRRQDLRPDHYRSLYEEELPGALRVEEHTAQLDHEKAREFQREFRQGKIHVLSCSTTFELGVDLGKLDTIFLRNVPPEAFNYAQRVGRAGRRAAHPGFAITYCRRAPHDLYHFSEPHRMLAGKVRPPVLSLRNEKIVARHMVATALSRFFRAFPEKFKQVDRLFIDMANPSAVAGFKAFLYEHQTELEESLSAIVPPDPDTAAQVGLDSGAWIDRIAGDKSRFSDAEVETASDYRTVRDLRTTAFEKGDDKTVVWAGARAKTIAEEDVLTFLSRKAVIPKYGFPVDVVELDTQRTQSQESSEVLLQRDLRIAIAEFAPTAQLVANKKVWTSYALKRVAEREWPRKSYKRCPRHNVFCQWDPGESELPTPCGCKLPARQYINPRFGFLTDRQKPKEPTSRIARGPTTRPYFANSLGPEPDSIVLPSPHSPLVTMKKASPGLMVVLSEGRRERGFYVCGSCGAGFTKVEPTHKTPYSQECHGTLTQVSLGHEFITDVVQLQFHPQPGQAVDSVWFGYSLAYALVEGAAEALEVPSEDLSAAVGHGGGEAATPPIILYDNVPGGAGLVARLEDHDVLRSCFEAAATRVGGACGCGEETSCYGCLRTYGNQFAHNHLQRGPVLHYLRELLEACA